MKTIIKILCLSVIWYTCESSTEPQDVHGCLDSQACNYNSDANIDNNSCEYPEPNYDCDDNCTVEIDCFDECGGIAELDDCGVCNGNNSNKDECGICNGEGDCTPFIDIINGDYDCEGSSSDACPLGNLDCPIVNPSGMIVDYFDITQFGGPHAVMIEDLEGYRIELTIWPDNWDIANDPEYSDLLEPPYNRYFIQALGNVFDYNGEKQILVCNPEDLDILD